MTVPVYGWVCVGTSTCCGTASSSTGSGSGSGSGSTGSGGSLGGVCGDVALIDLGGASGPAILQSSEFRSPYYYYHYSFTLPTLTLHNNRWMNVGVGYHRTIDDPNATWFAQVTYYFNGSPVGGGGFNTTGYFHLGSSVQEQYGLGFARFANTSGADITGDLTAVVTLFGVGPSGGSPLSGISPALSEWAMEAVEVRPGPAGGPTLSGEGNGPNGLLEGASLNPSASTSTLSPFIVSSSPQCAGIVAFLVTRGGAGSWSGGMTQMNNQGASSFSLTTAGVILSDPPDASTFIAGNSPTDGYWVIGALAN